MFLTGDGVEEGSKCDGYYVGTRGFNLEDIVFCNKFGVIIYFTK